MKLKVCLFVCLFGISDGVLAQIPVAHPCPDVSELYQAAPSDDIHNFNGHIALFWILPEGGYWVSTERFFSRPSCYVDAAYNPCDITIKSWEADKWVHYKGQGYPKNGGEGYLEYPVPGVGYDFDHRIRICNYIGLTKTGSEETFRIAHWVTPESP